MIARVLAIIGVLASFAAAQVTIDLPLKGYYRTGRYMPIQVSVPGSSKSVLIEGEGFVPLQIDNSGGGAINQIVPLLILSPPSRDVVVTIDGQKQSLALPMPLRERGDDERLVAFVGNVPDSVASHHFRTHRIARIDLPPAIALTGPPEAWESLDAVLFDPLPQSFATQPDALTRLAAQGVLLAIRSEKPLNELWPWKRNGEWFTLHHQPVGPGTSLAPSAYAPVATWSADFVASHDRHQIVGDAVIIAILALGATLLPTARKTIGGLLLVTVASMLLVGFWASTLPVEKLTAGTIGIQAGPLRQMDTWTYHTATFIHATRWSFDQQGVGRPMLIEPQDAQRLNLRTLCYTAVPRVDYTMTLSPEVKLAFMSRSVEPVKLERLPRTDQTPMYALVQRSYAGCRIIGDDPPRDERYYLGAVYLKTNPPSTKP